MEIAAHREVIDVLQLAGVQSTTALTAKEWENVTLKRRLDGLLRAQLDGIPSFHEKRFVHFEQSMGGVITKFSNRTSVQANRSSGRCRWPALVRSGDDSAGGQRISTLWYVARRGMTIAKLVA